MYTPPEASAWLGVTPVTLRKWAVEFQLWLSPSATQVSRGVARRYTEADLIVLSHVRAYLARNFTFKEIRTFLQHTTAADIATKDSHPVITVVSLPTQHSPARHATHTAIALPDQEA
jgi:DNA-binding transcriptional MerR regulator